MSHEDFVGYVGEGLSIAGHNVTLFTGFDALHILRIGRGIELPLVFNGNEGFEARIEKMTAAVKQWATRQRKAA
jgi:hypothetical protein